MNDHDARKYLTAFADGELDVEQSLEVLEYLKMNRDAADRVMHQQQLREQVARVTREATPATPDELRRKVAELAGVEFDATKAQPVDSGSAVSTEKNLRDARPGEGTPTDSDQSTPRSDVVARLGPRVRRWASAGAVAAAIVLVSFIAFNLPKGTAVAGEIDLAVRDRMLGRHDTCTHDLEVLHRAGVDQRISKVNTAVADVLGRASSPLPQLDLTAIGYELEGVGKCAVPGTPAVHLIYKPLEGAEDAPRLSLWIKPNDDSLDVENEQLYQVRGVEGGRRILVWRKGNSLYYLVGPGGDGVRDAATTMLAVGR